MYNNKDYRMMSKNAYYMIVMKNPRDVSHIRVLTSQLGLDKNLHSANEKYISELEQGKKRKRDNYYLFIHNVIK